MTKHRFDVAIAKLARRQHGVVNHAQVLALGGSNTMVRQRVDVGRWVRLARGVYALVSHPPTWQRQYKAAELSKPSAVICGRPAAMVHGFDGAKVLRPALAVPPGTSVRSTIADVRERDAIATTTVQGIRVTSAAQTLLDLLAEWPVHQVERAFDGALLSRRVDLADCDERLGALAGARHRNLKTFDALVRARRAEGYRPVESELEWGLAQVFRRLPPTVVVERQCSFPWWPEGPERLDFLIRDRRLIVEADGRRWHARVDDFDRDRWRDNVAHAHGHRVLRFTHAHVTTRPAEVLDLVLAASRWRTIAA